MPSWLVILMISVAVVLFFVVGMSLTLIIKGHYIDSEIGENENMKKRGIKCAAQQMREEEMGGEKVCGQLPECDEGNCRSCSQHVSGKKSNK